MSYVLGCLNQHLPVLSEYVFVYSNKLKETYKEGLPVGIRFAHDPKLLTK